MTIKIKHTHGQTETCDTLADAFTSLRSVYGDDIVVCGPGGWDLRETSDVGTLRTDRALVWQDEASSIDDDGARAVASLHLVD